MNRFTEEYVFKFRDHDPNASDTLTNVGLSTAWIDMLDYDEVTVVMFRTVGTGKVQNAGLYASAASTGTSAALVGSLHGSTNCTGSLVDATAGKTGTSGAGIVVLNATYDDIQKGLAGGRYICARASLATGTDELGVIYILRPRERAANKLATDNG